MVNSYILSSDSIGSWRRAYHIFGVLIGKRGFDYLSFSSPNSLGAADQLIRKRGSPCSSRTSSETLIDSRVLLLLCTPLLGFCHSAIAGEVRRRRHIERR